MDILVLHPGALGDLILSLPALRILRSHFPNACVTLAGNTDFTRAVAAGYADRLVSLSSLPLHRLYGSSEVPPEDEELWRSFDRVLSWTGYGTEAISGRLARLHPLVLSAPWKPAAGDRRHVSRIFMDSLAPWLSPPMEISPPEIFLRHEDRHRGAEWLKERGWKGSGIVIAVHPGAGSRAKRWPQPRFADLLTRLCPSAALLIVEGPAEPGLGQDLAAGLPAEALVAIQLPLGLLATILSHCTAYIGNDSGISHLAAGLGIPSVVLFGPTAPRHWAPLGDHVSLLVRQNEPTGSGQVPGGTRNGLPDTEVATVLRHMDRILKRAS